MLLQAPTKRAIAEAEYARAEDATAVIAGLKSTDASLQRVAVRAAGRLERPSLAEAVVPLLKSPDRDVRREAVAALAQMSAPFAFATLLSAEAEPAVRALIYEAIGRAKPPLDGAEGVLTSGLSEKDLRVRVGAARGLEALIRGSTKKSFHNGARRSG